MSLDQSIEKILINKVDDSLFNNDFCHSFD
jgi:hypothetical protein